MAIKHLLLTSLLLTSSVVKGAEKFIVEDIEIEGLQRVALGAALLNIPIRIGDEIDQQDVAKIIKSLYDSGNYEDIKVLKDNKVLVIEVKERPTISNISFSGNKAIKEEQLKGNLDASGIRIGEALDRTTLSNIEKGLEDFYYSVGKYNAEVKAVVTPLPRNRSDLKFVFTEGVSAKIQQINFIGNSVFSDEELRERFNLNVDVPWWNFLANEKYQKQVLAGDLEALRTFYLNQGYLKFQVSDTKVSISPDKKGVYITLTLDEGKPYTVKSVKFRGEVNDKETEFDEMVPFAVGDIYDGSAVTSLEENIKSFLGESGYAYPQVRTIPEFDDEKRRVALVVNVEAGKRIYVRDIRFTGNNATRDEVLRREMRQMEGSWLNSKAIDMGKRRLNRLGYFETVDVQTVRVPGAEDQVDLVYGVKEANLGSFNFGIGFGTESGLTFQLGLQQDNFLGSGKRVGVNTSTNKFSKNVSLEYRDPYWNLDGVSLGGKVFYNQFQASEAGIVDYTNESYGTRLTWGFPFDELNFFEIAAGYTHNRISDLDGHVQINKFLQAQEDNLDINPSDENDRSLNVDDFDFSLSWTRNNLNRGFFPTAGNHQRASYKMTVPGSDVEYYKLQYDIRQYIPITKKHEFTVLLRGRLGYGNGYGKNGSKDNLLPFYENFYAGGFSTLRGFRSNSAGPKAVYSENSTGSSRPQYRVTDEPVGGNALALASMELIFPVPWISEGARSQIRTSAFIDMASVWDTEFDYLDPEVDVSSGGSYYHDYSDPLNYRMSTGVALQWMSPIGPLVFSLSKPIKKYEGDKDEVFTFTIGSSF